MLSILLFIWTVPLKFCEGTERISGHLDPREKSQAAKPPNKGKIMWGQLGEWRYCQEEVTWGKMEDDEREWPLSGLCNLGQNAAKSLQSCPTLCDPMDCSLPGFSIPGILQARTLEWVAISFSNAWKWKVKVKSLSRVPLSDPMDCSLPGSSIHGIFQARVLEWGAIELVSNGW